MKPKSSFWLIHLLVFGLCLPTAPLTAVAQPAADHQAARLLSRGDVKLQRQDFAGAIEEYSRAIRLDPGHALAYSNRARARLKLGDLQGVIADCTEALRLDPDLAVAYGNRGNARAALGDRTGAAADYSEVIRRDPNNALALHNRALARAALGDTAGALGDLKKAAQLAKAQGDSTLYRSATSRIRQYGTPTVASVRTPKATAVPRSRPVAKSAPTAEPEWQLRVPMEPRPVPLMLGLGIGEGGGPGLAIVNWVASQTRHSGLRTGDRLVALDGRAVDSTADLSAMLRRRRPGEQVALTYRRGGSERTMNLALLDSVVPLEPEEPPRPLGALPVLPPSSRLEAEQIFGWGNVRSVEGPDSEPLVVVGPLASEAVLRERTGALFRRLQPSGVRALAVEVEAPAQPWRAVVSETGVQAQAAQLPWRSAPVTIEAGTYLPVQLDWPADGPPPNEGQDITGRVLYDARDRRGIPLVRAGTAVQGQLVPTAPVGVRLVLASLGANPVAAESEVLPLKEEFELRSGLYGGGDLFNRYFATVYDGQVVGARLREPVVLEGNAPGKPSEATPARTAVVGELLSGNLPGRRDPKQALAFYNQGVRAAAASQWQSAAALWQASLILLPSQPARSALGWVYERMGQELLVRGDAATAAAWLELAVHLRPRSVNASRLLSAAYGRLLAAKASANRSPVQLAYYRHLAARFDLSMGEELGGSGRLFAREPARPTTADYIDSSLVRGQVVRFTRLPIRLYTGGAPEPEMAAAVWRAALKWQTGSGGAVQFMQVEDPLQADIAVVFVAADREGRAGHATFTGLGNRMPMLKVTLGLGHLLGERPGDLPEYVQMLAVHELGHAIGLWGHSDDPEDIMYPEMRGVHEPSGRDLQTLWRLYAMPAGITRP
ncbi:tetratricopeptide repeat protein [Gloeobacter violaceus]|nr:tetratricopeptide repeat protein [Gloeobacter violaceus]